MKPLIDIKPVDTQYYESRLRDFLPERIIDIHTHVWLAKDRKTGMITGKRTVTWPARVARDNSIEDLLETYRLMLPGKKVTPLIFSSLLDRNYDFDAGNGYIRDSAERYGLPALIFARPDWPADDFERKTLSGGFIGAKVYLSLSDESIPRRDITIFDFLPRHQLEVLDHHGWMVMLHIPRDGRLKDPKNLEQIIEIEKKYPNVKLIIAHVGRAYCNGDVGNAFDVLSECDKMVFDITANTNDQVFEQLIKAVGPKRILFGSDMPILRMRMRRIEKEGRYVNLVPKGLYGDVSDDPNMGGVEGEEAEKLSFFLYEEIDAFRRAAERCNLNPQDISDVFHNNGERLIAAAKGLELTTIKEENLS
jgi:predicted TIM-barrel fold metal-dependent hydrolase